MTSSDTMNQGVILDFNTEVRVPADGVTLKGYLHLPPHVQLLVISANNGSGDRAHRCNRYVTEALHRHHIGTLVIDLLTPEEEQFDEIVRELHFDTLMLAGRLDRVVEWARIQPTLRNIGIGYFCSSTCSGAALVAAAQHPRYVVALVCLGARSDLAGPFLSRVTAPTLLLVGENDKLVIELNRQFLAKLNKQSELSIIPDATYLFEEPGALEEMVQQVVAWFVAQLPIILEEGQKTSL